jgi:hypothetical protein
LITVKKNLHISQSEKKNCSWWPYLLAEWNQMKMLYRRSCIDASCQVWFNLAKQFQGRSLFNIQEQFFFSDWLMLKKSSPLKPLGQMNRNLVGSIIGRSSIKIAHLVPIHQ